MLLSIITINLNNADGLKATMEAIRSELTSEMEWIVMDGGSSDDSVAIIESHQDALAHYESKPDQGIYHAMNKGVQVAKGDWIWFMNSGDLPVPGMISKLFEHDLSEYQIVYGQNYSAQHGKTGKLVIKDYPWTLLSFMNGCIPHQSTLTRRSVLLNTPFHPSYKIAGCRIFFIETIVQQGFSYRYFPIPLSICDQNGISVTQKEKLLFELDEYIRTQYGHAVYTDLKTLQKFNALTENRTLFDLLKFSSGRPKIKKWLDRTAGFLLKMLSK